MSSSNSEMTELMISSAKSLGSRLVIRPIPFAADHLTIVSFNAGEEGRREKWKRGRERVKISM